MNDHRICEDCGAVVPFVAHSGKHNPECRWRNGFLWTADQPPTLRLQAQQTNTDPPDLARLETLAQQAKSSGGRPTLTVYDNGVWCHRMTPEQATLAAMCTTENILALIAWARAQQARAQQP